VDFIGVYIREAHPTDGWRMDSNDQEGIAFAQPTTDEERTAIATQCCSALELPMPVVVDRLDDAVNSAYSGFPDRLYVIDTAGRVAYKGGRGPMGYKPLEMEQVLAMTVLDDWLTAQLGPAGTQSPAGGE
jgi:hypothetical protein